MVVRMDDIAVPSRSLTASLPLKSYRDPAGKANVFKSQHFSVVNLLLNFATRVVAKFGSNINQQKAAPKSAGWVFLFNSYTYLKANMTSRKIHYEWVDVFSMFFLFKIRIFQCHVCFSGEAFQRSRLKYELLVVSSLKLTDIAHENPHFSL